MYSVGFSSESGTTIERYITIDTLSDTTIDREAQMAMATPNSIIELMGSKNSTVVLLS